MDDSAFNEAEAEKAVCTSCATPLVRRPLSGGWRHEVGMAGGACVDPVPMVPALDTWVN